MFCNDNKGMCQFVEDRREVSGGFGFPPPLPGGYDLGMSEEPNPHEPPYRELRAISAVMVALCGAILIAANRTLNGLAEVGGAIMFIGLIVWLWNMRPR